MTHEFSGKRIVVMGLGRFGGGIGVTRWLCKQGANVHVTDLATRDDLAASLDALIGLPFTHRLGSHDECDLDGCNLLVVSPAVDKVKSDFFKAAIRRGIPWTSEMNLFLQRCRGQIVGITGTVGKSTTTAMIGAILESAHRSTGWGHGRVWLGGNIGKSLLDELPSIGKRDIVVLELSSFQLEDAAQIRRSPQIAVVTNLRDNHLDRHGTMPAYADAKANIYRFQSADDWVVMPKGEGIEHLPADWTDRRQLVRYGIDATSRRIRIEGRAETGLPTSDTAVQLAVPGLHNLQNAAAALAVARILGVTDPASCVALAHFAGLVHRLEFVREYQGVKYYNDSKATTPDAAMTSLRAFDGGVVMMVGGSDKGSPFEELGRLIAQRAKAAVCIGQTAPQIAAAIVSAKCDTPGPEIRTATTFSEAIDSARELAEKGDVVLLSPACASYDWFKNYEERGDHFKKTVLGWP
ncbi:MAG TPA: UDP-N-acetylmuramoyl-L-alanine--D-glutamate ligase [Phycisphaerae bacterium]|nr:UDP-N-acetylmuramoyl-L-alanine--D-glutamate ligase [Phycisphaerae bacterium]